MKKWKGAAALLLAVVLAGSMSACGSKGLSSNAVAEDSYVDTGWGMPANEEVAEAAALSEEAPAESKVSVDASLSEADQTAAQDKDQKAAKRKLIRNVNMSMETTEFDELLVLIEQKVTELGGYIESSSVDGTPDSNRRNSYLCVRVPADQLEAFETMLGNSATVLSKSSSVEDVTLRYSDLAAHIESLRIEQETLMEMLSKAEDVDTVLIIQNELTNIRYQLESYESQMKVMDNQIDYSTVSINIREVKVPTAQEQEGFFSRLKKTFTNSIRNLGTDIEDFLIIFLGNIVGIVLFIAIAIGVLFLIRSVFRFVFGKKDKVKRERKSRRKKGEKKEAAEENQIEPLPVEADETEKRKNE